MTREELKEHCLKEIEMCEFWAIGKGEKPSGKVYEEHKLILELLEQETVSKEVYDHEYFLRKEFEIKIVKLKAKLEQQESILDKIKQIIDRPTGNNVEEKAYNYMMIVKDIKEVVEE